uniref:SMODS domain-containing nucleotidyltransferase n=1 Tax=Roseomonas rosulenta TaxID=2748667 RepID=UPI0018DF722C
YSPDGRGAPTARPAGSKTTPKAASRTPPHLHQPITQVSQSSPWEHGTIIKPVDGDEFDADLLVFVDPVENWTAAEYVKQLGAAFAASGVYKDKYKTWDYCVTITYCGERKIDLAPCVMGRLRSNHLEVCNRTTDSFEQSEPVEFTQWPKRQNGYSGSNSFRKITRLLKYLRDIKTTFTCPSVLLTTLLGMQISRRDQGSDEFTDVPTTLRTVMQRLDDWLQARPFKPRVENPSLPTEDFAASLTQMDASRNPSP